MKHQHPHHIMLKSLLTTYCDIVVQLNESLIDLIKMLIKTWMFSVVGKIFEDHWEKWVSGSSMGEIHNNGRRVRTKASLGSCILFLVTVISSTMISDFKQMDGGWDSSKKVEFIWSNHLSLRDSYFGYK